MSALATIAARTCEGCGTVQARHDDLHLCECEDQQNLCKPCREACAAKLREGTVEIPRETMDAATIQFMKTLGYSEKAIKETQQEAGEDWLGYRRRVWLVLEAAGVPALLERIADYEAAYRKVMAEQCASDERHCTCVPALRQRIAELEAEIARNQACIRLKLLPFEKEILEKYPEHQKTIDGWNDFLKRIAELETENAALRQKAQASAGGGE